ncbi:MAG: hypothetical protein JNK82_42585 [Myxococcaceae bacterium]|nr:hypothetical protein [Myxococcaceae bacterium]
MKVSRGLWGVAVAVSALTAAGCTNNGLEAACQRQQQVTCKRSFECARGLAELTYGTEQNCVTAGYRSCEAFRDFACDDLGPFNACLANNAQASCTNMSLCVTELSNAGCRNVASGRATCSSSNVNSTGNACTVTLSQCSDNRVYTLSCSGSSCTCNDGQSQRAVNGSCGDKSTAIATCGWNVQ